MNKGQRLGHPHKNFSLALTTTLTTLPACYYLLFQFSIPCWTNQTLPKIKHSHYTNTNVFFFYYFFVVLNIIKKGNDDGY